MGTGINVPFEMIAMSGLMATFWVLFCELYSPPKLRRILLIIGIVLFHPVWVLVVYNTFVQVPHAVAVLLPVAMMAGLAALAAGELKSVWIMTAYFAGAYLFIDAIASCISLGLEGRFGFSNQALYIGGIASVYAVFFALALTYYFITRNIKEEELDRIPLSSWLVILLIQPVGLVLFYIPIHSLLKQFDSGYNNFLFLGCFLLVLLVLSFVIMRLLVKLVSGFNGISPEFIKKYGLTEREAEIAVALLNGKSNKEIADSSFISVPTVKTHLQTIYRKTGASSRYALMTLATQRISG
jgi:DNA-binding CsgD family transcriptional regulator